MNLTQVRETVNRLGLNAALQDIARRAASKVTEVTILKGVRLTMDTVDRKFLSDDAGYRWGFLDADTLRAAVRRQEGLGMDAAFVEAALLRGDRCYAALDGDVVASYGWYSTRPTAVTAISDDLVLHFDSAYAYMYRGYTLPAYRGKRLHGIGMARAMRACVEDGKKGLVSVVESSNLPSLTSCYRLGYRDFGELYCIEVAGRHYTYATRGCRAYDVHAKVQDG